MNHPLSFQSKEVRPWPNEPFKRGCIVGHTTAHSTTLWIQAKAPGRYQVVLSLTPLLGCEFKEGRWQDNFGEDWEPVLTQSIEITQDQCLTGVFRLDHLIDPELPSLKPSTRYYYGIRFDNRWVLGAERKASFQTLALQGDLKFAFYSCHMPYKNRQLTENASQWSNLKEVIERFNVDFLIAGGDQVYSDGNPKVSIIEFLKKHKDKLLREDPQTQVEIMKSWYQDVYKGYWGFKDLNQIYAHHPVYMTWDDHEIMDGWGSYDEEALEYLLKDGLWETSSERRENRSLMYRMFQAASEVYYYYQHSHNPDTGLTPSIVQDPSTTPHRQWHYHFYAQESAFFVMDTRGHKSLDQRDPHHPHTNSLLGQLQIDDFKEFLASSQTRESKALFITSAVPFVHWSQFVVDLAEVTNLLGTRDDVRDEWDHPINHPERNQILDAIFEFAETNDTKVFILSGDVHCAASFQLIKAGSQAKVYQLTSSAITYAKNQASWLVKKAVAETGILSESDIGFKRLTPVETKNNFAMIEVKQGLDEVEVCLDLYARGEREEGMMMYERLRM